MPFGFQIDKIPSELYGQYLSYFKYNLGFVDYLVLS